MKNEPLRPVWIVLLILSGALVVGGVFGVTFCFLWDSFLADLPEVLSAVIVLVFCIGLLLIGYKLFGNKLRIAMKMTRLQFILHTLAYFVVMWRVLYFLRSK